MNADESLPPDEACASFLAAYDDALAGRADPEAIPDAPPELHARLERGLACLHLFEQAWPRGRETVPPSDTPVDSVPRPEPAGMAVTIGRFQVRRELGRGGSGHVFLAHDPQLGRDVALKVPRLDVVLTPELRDRFLQEARAAAGLDHPNLVPVYDAGEVGPVCYIASAYCPGTSLDAWLTSRREPVPWWEAAQLVATLADAVQHAHDRGVLHRDLKPANILLQKSDIRHTKSEMAGDSDFGFRISDFIPKITDFGLAKLRAGGEGVQTQSGAIVGTPSYMAPEQAAGRSREIGPEGDVYALGAVLYELLTGRPPFAGGTALDTLEQVRSLEPVSPRRLRHGLPRDLETITLKCLEKEPHRRNSTSRELADDLGRLLRGESIRARPVGVAGRLARWCRRNPYLATATGLAAGALLAVAVISVIFGFSQARALKDSEEQRQLLTEAKDALELAAVQRQQLAAGQSLEQGLRLCEQGYANRGLVRLAHSLQLSPAQDADLRLMIRRSLRAWRDQVHLLRAVFPQEVDDAISSVSLDGLTAVTVQRDHSACLWDTVTGQPRGAALRHESLVKQTAFSRDGRFVMTWCEDRTARLWEVARGKPAGPPLRHSAPLHGVALSPDGQTAATIDSEAAVLLWSTRTGRALGEPLRHNSKVVAVGFSPDGRILYTWSADNTARLFAVDTRKPLGPPLAHQGEIAYVALSPDGRTVLTASLDKTARLWGAATGQPLGPPLQHQGEVRAGAFSPDGRLIVTGGEDRAGQLWEVATGKPWGPPLRHDGCIYCVAFSGDGRMVVTGSEDKTVRLWEAATGRAVACPLEHPSCLCWAQLVPSAKSVYTIDNGGPVRVWDVATEPLPRVLVRDQGPLTHLALSASGRCFATTSKNGSARLWDTASGRPLGPPVRHAKEVWAVGLEPDGRFVLTGSQDATAKLWDGETGKLLLPTLQHAAEIDGVAVSPDGKTVLTGNYDFKARLWEVATGKPTGPVFAHPDKIFKVAFSPDGSRILTGCRDGDARVWDAVTGQLLHTLGPHLTGVASVAFSPDGQTVLTGGYDHLARIWDLSTGKPRGRPLVHRDTVYAVAFSPDGKTAATAGGAADKTARLWNASTGHAIGPPLPHGGGVNGVAFSADGRTVLAASEDGMVRQWDVPVPVADEPERIGLWAQVITGLELDGQGEFRGLGAEEWRERRRRLDELGGPP
jgi:WD40 repeat protein